jgi:hypothetical protein
MDRAVSLPYPENVSVAAMREVEFSVPQKCDLKLAERLIEEICGGRGLQVAMKGRNRSFPDPSTGTISARNKKAR